MKFSHLLLLAAALPAFAATTATWELTSFADFIRGKLTGVSLNAEGRLELSPRIVDVYASEQPQIWSVARAADGMLYLGSGHKGRVYSVDRQGKGSVLWTSDQPEIFAVAADDKAVYAGTSPDGKIYRIEKGKATEYFAPPQARYIWALRFGPDGALYAATGEPGRVYRITAPGKGDIYYDSGQTHVTCLAFDSTGKLLAGSEPNGILYRVESANKAFVLFDANLPEIRSILTTPEGAIYAAALGGSLTRRGGAPGAISGIPSGAMVVAPAQSITVTDAQSGLTPRPSVTSGIVSSSPIGAAGAQSFEIAGVEKSAVYRINPDNTVDTMFSSKDENIYDIAIRDGKIVFSTDGQGRVYTLGDDRKASLIAQTNEAETTRLVASTEGLLGISGSAGKLFRIGDTLTPKGEYESPVHDAGTVARWGRLSWRIDNSEAGAGAITFRTRTGNSNRPDNTWSDWSAPLSDKSSALIKSPNARFIQWKVELTAGNGGKSPAIQSVTAAYLPQNTAPTVRSVSVTTTAAKQAGAAAAASASATSSFSITVSESGETSGAAGAPSQAVGRQGGPNIQVTWQADDPEGDRLIYVVYFRGEDEREWKLLRANFFDNSLTIDGDVLADGRYVFRVVAHDRPSNPLEYARQSEGLSSPVLIDNTPPTVKLSTAAREGARVEFAVEAADATSALKRCEYSIDASAWVPVEAADGVTDSQTERFDIRLDNLRPGEHVVVVRTYDQAGNAGLAKTVVR